LFARIKKCGMALLSAHALPCLSPRYAYKVYKLVHAGVPLPWQRCGLITFLGPLRRGKHTPKRLSFELGYLGQLVL